MFRKMPIFLLAFIFLIVVVNPILPLSCKEIFFAVSLSIKSLILFLLPLLIFTLLFKTAVEFAERATKMILFLVLAICCSNFLSTLLSYGVGHLVYSRDLAIAYPPGSVGLSPAWIFNLPEWISNSHALFGGLGLGILFGRFAPKRAQQICGIFNILIEKLLKVFIALMPFFVGGYVLKLASDGMIGQIVKNYAGIFAIVGIAQFSYIAFLYLIGSRIQKLGWLKSLQNMLPAAIAGFGTMSSASAMPLTLMGAEKNSASKEVAKAVIPATVNVHLIGDCLAIPIFAFALLKNFSVPEPSFFVYCIFACYFVMAKFSVAAIPGGGILVMLPILEKYLGFNAEMMSLITALYILFDPVITCANVLGNGAFSMIMSRSLCRTKDFV